MPRKNQGFNETHPELMEGEMFLHNVFGNDDWESLRYKTKRLGIQAYTREGVPLRDPRPAFVQRTEFEKTEG